ncbi:MAG: shikimate dehydrogenase [Oscillospiraceae bacterium]
MNTLRLGVIGDPIAHTLSPMIHSKMAEHLNISATYTADHVTKAGLGDFVKKAVFEKWAGFNVTIPHKNRIMDFCEELDPYAAKCGAVNTVRICDGRLIGYNTDGDGLYASLKSNDIRVWDSDILLLGAGGAALSVCRKALDAGAKKITVFCRTPEKAIRFQQDARVAVENFSTLAQTKCAENADLIINATPLGMQGMDADFTDVSFLDHTNAAVYDIVYKPEETKLLRESKNRGLRAFNGLGMLVYQAVYAFAIFSGETFDFDGMASYLLKEITKEIYNK